MKHPQYFTDKAYAPPKVPFYNKISFRVPVISLFALTVIVFLSYELLREKPPQNVVSRITYLKSKLQIALSPETVNNNPKYELVRLSDNQYYLEIKNSEIGYTSDTEYDFGSISNIKRERIEGNFGRKQSRIIVTFSELEDTPEVVYEADPPRFELKFNKHLEEQFIVILDPGGGTFSGSFRSGSREVRATLDIAAKVKELLKESEDAEVVLSRDFNRRVGFRSRNDFLTYYTADMYISIRPNGSYVREDKTDIYYAGYGENNKANQKLALAIRNNLQESLKTDNDFVRARGFIPDDQDKALFGSVMIETSNLTVPAFDKRIAEIQEYKAKVADAIVNAVREVVKNKN